MDMLFDIVFWVLLMYTVFILFDLLDDIQKSPKWVEGHWRKK